MLLDAKVPETLRLPRAAGAFLSLMVLLFFLLATCAAHAAPGDGDAATTQAGLRDALMSRGSDHSSDMPGMPAPLLAFYTARDFAPVWTGSPEAEAMGREVLDVLARADDQGLRASDYAATAARWSEIPTSGPEAAAYDASLTADLLRYASDVCLGRIYPRDVYPDVSLPARRFDIAQALETALKDRAIGAFLAGLPPPHPEYRALAASLTRYREIAAQGGWPVVSGKDEPQLVARLAAEDSMAGGNIADAVQRFQSRNGIKPDGRVGSVTLAALNKPVSQRIAQIIANMERWRWLPHNFEKRYILVNVPDQSVLFINDGNVLLSSRAAVGKLSSKTPILRMEAVDMVVNPPWDVPGDIADASILPELRRNPNYLASRNMVLVDGPSGGTDIDWRKMKSLPYQVQQNPGPENAMGALMLDSPNPYGVYLHDTPGKTVFASEMRQKSNGCIRVEQMFPLASLALTNDDGEGLARLGEAAATGQTQRLALDQPLPVYLLYFTAVPEPDGTLGFRDDFYGRDKPLLAAMDKTRVAAR